MPSNCQNYCLNTVNWFKAQYIYLQTKYHSDYFFKMKKMKLDLKKRFFANLQSRCGNVITLSCFDIEWHFYILIYDKRLYNFRHFCSLSRFWVKVFSLLKKPRESLKRSIFKQEITNINLSKSNSIYVRFSHDKTPPFY